MSGDGTRAGLDAAMAAAEPACAGEPEQLDLLDGDDDPQDALGLPALTDLQAAMIAARRGPGRPKGARNRRTEATLAYLMARHRMPLEGLLAMAEMEVEELAMRLKCSPLDAWQEKRLCWIAALPYCHQRQPLAVDVTDRKIVHLTIVDGEVAPAGADEGGMTLDARIVTADPDEEGGEQ